MHKAINLSPSEQAWIDWRWTWLTERFGTPRLRESRIVCETQDVFQVKDCVTDEMLRIGLNTFATAMGFKPADIVLFIQGDQTPDAVADVCEAMSDSSDAGQLPIWVKPEELSTPHHLAAYLPCRLVQAHFSRCKWLDESVPDAGPLFELGAIYLGAGVVTANISITDTAWSDSVFFFHWKMNRVTSMSQAMLGYGLARFALDRRDDEHLWSRSLRQGVRRPFEIALRELQINPPTPVRQPPDEDVFVPNEMDDPDAWDIEAPSDVDYESSDQVRLYCTACAYELTGLPQGACPECGAAFDPEDATTVETTRPVLVPKAVDWITTSVFKLLMWVLVGFCVLGLIGAIIIAVGAVM